MTQTKIHALDAAIETVAAMGPLTANTIPHNVLALLAASVSCTLVIYWRVSEREHVLIPDTAWITDPRMGLDLERDTMGRQLSIDEGTAGHVWRSRKPIWTSDLIEDMCLPRSLDANANGLHGGIWFAVKTNSVVYGVMEMLSPDVGPADECLLLAIERLGVVLGETVERGAAKE